MKNSDDIEKNINKIKGSAMKIGLGIVLLVMGYASFLLYASWPIDSFNINSAGVFGDSFGILTSLFSGLAFTGIIVTVFLQHEELALQRLEIGKSNEQFKRSADIQNEMLALAVKQSEHSLYLAKLEIKTNQLSSVKTLIGAFDEDRQGKDMSTRNKLTAKRKVLFSEIEKLIMDEPTFGINKKIK